MCGLFAFQRRSGPPQAEILTDIAGRAGTRGPHAHGHATGQRRHVTLGPLDPARLSSVVDSVIGHARLATAGGHADLTCAQPLAAGELFIAHNGTVPNHQAHAAIHHLTLCTDSDSEVLAQLLTHARSLAGIASTLDWLTPGVPLALLILHPDGEVTAARRGHPLHVLRAPEGTYLCSLPFTGSVPLPDSTATHFSRAGETTQPLSTTASLRAAQGGPAWIP